MVIYFVFWKLFDYDEIIKVIYEWILSKENFFFKNIGLYMIKINGI